PVDRHLADTETRRDFSLARGHGTHSCARFVHQTCTRRRLLKALFVTQVACHSATCVTVAWSESGEDGIRSGLLAYVPSTAAFATQALLHHRLAILWSLTVLCGCLRLFGIGFSTLSAHPVCRQDDLFPPFAATHVTAAPSRRRQK